MRNLKFSFAFIVAILAVGLTVASKANMIGSKAWTDCLTVVTLGDGINTPIDPVAYAAANDLNCEGMEDLILDQTTPYKYLYSANVAQFDNSCDINRDLFCCVTFAPDPNQATSPAPQLDLPGATPDTKYIVTAVKCRFE